jgi:hypothetical protein
MLWTVGGTSNHQFQGTLNVIHFKGHAPDRPSNHKYHGLKGKCSGPPGELKISLISKDMPWTARLTEKIKKFQRKCPGPPVAS